MEVDYDLGETFDIGAPLDLLADAKAQVNLADAEARAQALIDEIGAVDHWLAISAEKLRIIKLASLALELRHKCESPIEVEFGAELMARCPDGYSVYPQFKWQDFRMDFVIICNGKILAFIECDGAEFHSTQQQIERDKRKDRAANDAGIKLFRFTGSEIFRSAWACAALVWQQIEDGAM